MVFAPPIRLLRFTCLLALSLPGLAALSGCRSEPPDGRVHIAYWEKWTGVEEAAMKAVVDDFNQSQDHVFVEFLSVSGIDRKALLATAGGDPPDIAGVWVRNIASWADSNALESLDPLIEADGMTPEEFLSRYEKSYAELCVAADHVYGVPSTPAAIALHWNKKLFREAGLDPERPPRNIEELFEYSKKLTKRDPVTGELQQVGFLPQDPGWWRWAFPLWFGGSLMDENNEISVGTDPKNVKAMEWDQTYSKLYGPQALKVFTSGFGQMGSPQYPFFAGKVGMVLQGVWLNNYLRQFAPGLDYGVCAWPVADPKVGPYTVVEADMLVIPRGAHHPKAAWEFLKYISSINPNARSREELKGQELLCYLQEKNSPLRVWSPFFSQHHPHPFINVFRDLARLPNAGHVVRMGIWSQYSREFNVAEERIRFLETTPEEGLAAVQERISESWQRHQESVARHTAKREANKVARAVPAPSTPTP